MVSTLVFLVLGENPSNDKYSTKGLCFGVLGFLLFALFAF